MRPGRPDYDGRIVDRQQRIGEQEPVFVLRAGDEFAPGLVTLWAEQMYARGGDPRLIAMAHEQARRMSAWQRAHGSKVPDLPGDVIEIKADDGPRRRTVYGE